MNGIIVRLLLIVSGLIAMAVGAAVLFAPETLFASSGVTLMENASLMSEIRAPGGLLIASGLLIVLAAFVTSFINTGLALSALVYISYGASRLWSIAVDGMPSDVLVQAAGLELVIGIICLFALLKRGADVTVSAALN